MIDNIELYFTITPMHAMRTIEITFPWYTNTSFAKIGKGIYHKHAPNYGYCFNKIGSKLNLKSRLLDNDGDEVYRNCIGGQYLFRR